MRYTQIIAARADTGAVMPYATVTVLLTGTGTRAQLYAADASTKIDNPVVADGTGLVGFSISDGTYDIQVVSADGRYSVPLMRQVEIVDLTNIRGTITSGRLAYATWAELAAVTGEAGQVAEVPLSDTGSHSDPAGGTVQNSGIFRWQASPAGWHRIYDNEAGALLADIEGIQGDIAPLNSRLTPLLVGEQFVPVPDIVDGDIWTASVDTGPGSASGFVVPSVLRGAAMYEYTLDTSGGTICRVQGVPRRYLRFIDLGLVAGDQITLAIATRNMSPSYPENSAYLIFQFMQAGQGGQPFDGYTDLPDGTRVHHLTLTLTPEMLADSSSSGNIGSFLLRTDGSARVYSGQIGAPMFFRGARPDFIEYLDTFCRGDLDHSAATLVGLGMSFIEGASATSADRTFMALTAAYMNRPQVNLGRGGQRLGEIAARFGAIPMVVSVTSIAGSGYTSIPSGTYNEDIGYYAGVSANDSYTGVAYPIGGGTPVRGIMRGLYGGQPGIHKSGNYRFERAVAGQAISCPQGFNFISDLGEIRGGDTLVMMLFQNDFETVGQADFNPVPFVETAVKIVERMRPRFPTIRLMQDWNTPYSAADATFSANLNRLDDLLELALGPVFLRTRDLAVRHGLQIAGITPDAGNNQDISIGAVPRALREPNGGGDPRGGLHPNDPGHYVLHVGLRWSLARGL